MVSSRNKDSSQLFPLASVSLPKEIRNMKTNSYDLADGGAFVRRPTRTCEAEFATRNMTNEFTYLALFVHYRLAGDSPFLAILQDAVTAYHYLLRLGVTQSRIMITGQGAGCNIALALLWYLTERRCEDRPKACIIWDPWLNLSGPDPSEVYFLYDDIRNFLPRFMRKWWVKCDVPRGMYAADHWFSPMENSFPTQVPIFIMQAKGLKDTTEEYVIRMQAAGCTIKDLWFISKTYGSFQETLKTLLKRVFFVDQIRSLQWGITRKRQQ